MALRNGHWPKTSTKLYQTKSLMINLNRYVVLFGYFSMTRWLGPGYSRIQNILKLITGRVFFLIRCDNVFLSVCLDCNIGFQWELDPFELVSLVLNYPYRAPLWLVTLCGVSCIEPNIGLLKILHTDFDNIKKHDWKFKMFFWFAMFDRSLNSHTSAMSF